MPPGFCLIYRPGLAQQVLDGGTLFAQLVFRRLHLATAEVVDLQALNNLVVAVLATHGVGVDDAFGDAVTAIGRNRHADDAVGAQRPVAHVIDGGGSGGSGGRSPARLDDGGAALLHGGDEVVFVPVTLDQIESGLAIYLGVGQIGVLGGAVVAPDDHAVDVGNALAGFLRQLGQGAVVVKASHGSELTRVEIRRVARSDQGVGVGRVADDQYTHVAAGVVIERLALHREDRGVGFQQVLALHARSARARTHQQREVSVLERDIGIVGGNDILHQREGAVVDFHDDTVERIHGLGNFEQLQNDRLIRTQHVTCCDTENERVADLAGTAGDGNTYGVFHFMLLFSHPADANGQDSMPARRETQSDFCLTNAAANESGMSALPLAATCAIMLAV